MRIDTRLVKSEVQGLVELILALLGLSSLTCCGFGFQKGINVSAYATFRSSLFFSRMKDFIVSVLLQKDVVSMAFNEFILVDPTDHANFSFLLLSANKISLPAKLASLVVVYNWFLFLHSFSTTLEDECGAIAPLLTPTGYARHVDKLIW